MKSKLVAWIVMTSILASQINVMADVIDSASIENGVLTVSGDFNNDKSQNVGIYVLKNGVQVSDIKNLAGASDWISNIGFTETDETGAYTYNMTLSNDDYTGQTLVVSSEAGFKTIPLSGYELYVSPEGNDSAEGSYNAPLKTLDGARLKVREIKAGADYDNSPITVSFLPGEYDMRSVVSFTEADSGTALAPITYRAYESGTVIFNYAIDLDISKLQAVTDEEILKRLPETSRGKVYSMRLDGFTDSDTIFIGYSKLYLNDKPQTISRWPNVGYEDMLLDNGESSIIDDGTVSGKPVIKYESENIDRWSFAKHSPFVIGYFNNQYQSNMAQVVNVDTENKQITLSGGTIADDNRRWFAYNLLEEIDLPGEFYIQRSTDEDEANYLYYYPAYDINQETDRLELIGGYCDSYIKLDGVSNINFKDIKISKTCGNGIYGTSCNAVNIDGCEVEFCERGGIIFEESTNIAVKNCNVHNVHSAGISILNTDKELVLNTQSCGNVIENNHMYSVNENNATSSAGNNASGYGAVFKNNTVHKAPSSAVYSPSADGYYAYNELYNLARDSADVGAVYAGNTLTMYGTKFEYNYIHDLGMEGFTENEHTSGLFWDDFLSGQTAENNIIVNDYRGNMTNGTSFGVNMNGGRDNTVKNNIIVGSDYAFRNLDRSNTSYKNSEALTALYNDLQSVVSNTDSAYVKKYPQMTTAYNEMSAVLNGYKFNPSNITLTGNVVADCPNASTENGGAYINGRLASDTSVLYNVANTVTINNYISEDRSVFVNPSIGDYRLSAEGKEKLGVTDDFKLDTDFDMSSIGYQGDIQMNDEFKLVYPQNNSVTDKARAATLSWENNMYADEYTYTVSKNADLSNPVLTDTTVYNTVEISGLEADTVYYWSVSAANVSFSNAVTADSESGIFKFITDKDVSLNNAVYSSADNKITIDISNEGDSVQGDIYAAQYNGQNKLISVKKQSETIVNDENTLYIDEFVPDAEGEACVIYVWYKDTMKPITSKSERIKLK